MSNIRAAARLPTLLACLPLVAACDRTGETASGDGSGVAGGGDAEARLERWIEERPDTPVRAAVAFDQILSDSAVWSVLDRHSVEAYAAEVRIAGLETRHRVPPEDASPDFTDQLRNQVVTGLEMALCAQRGRAGALLDPGRASPDEARAVLSRVHRSMEALERLRESGARYVAGVQVVGMPEDILRLSRDPAVAAVEPAVLVDGRVVVPETRSTADDTAPADTAGLGELSPAALMERLESLATGGLPGCSPAAPPAARRDTSTGGG